VQTAVTCVITQCNAHWCSYVLTHRPRKHGVTGSRIVWRLRLSPRLSLGFISALKLPPFKRDTEARNAARRSWPDGHKGSLEGVEVRSLTSTLKHLLWSVYRRLDDSVPLYSPQLNSLYCKGNYSATSPSPFISFKRNNDITIK